MNETNLIVETIGLGRDFGGRVALEDVFLTR